jgi:hypothetical protein
MHNIRLALADPLRADPYRLQVRNDRYRLMIIKFLQSLDAEDQVGSHFSATRSRRNIGAMAEFIETSSMSESSNIVAAHLTKRDYRLARLSIPAMAAFQDYEDWLDYRMGTFWGLEMAGFTVEIIPVDLSAFLAWSRRTSEALSISALDRFARIGKVRIIETKRQEGDLQG